MFAFGKKKGPALGLDVNGDTLTIMQIERTKAGVELTGYACLPTPPNAVREGLIADPETLGGVLRELIEQSGVAGGVPTLAVAAPGQSVVVRLMPVPTGMPQEELADVVAQEAINHVPFPMREANLDWSVMAATERTDADGVSRVDVVLAAIQKTIVDSYWRMAEAAGVKIGRIDVSSLAVIRALVFSGYLERSGELTMVVTIRHDATDINLVKNGMPLFSRSVLLGVETLGEALARSLDVHLDEALKMLPEVQLFGMAPMAPQLGQAAQIARTVFGDITDEVGRSLEFYRSQVGEVSMNRIILCGAGCVVPQLDQFMANRLNIQTTVANPLRDVLFDGDLIREERRAAQAMVLGSVVGRDLLPIDAVELDLNKEGPSSAVLEAAEDRPTVRIVSEEVETPWFVPALGAGAAVLILAAAAWAYFAQYDLPRRESELEQITQEIEIGNKKLKSLDSLKKDNANLVKKKKLLDSIINSNQPWSAVLQVLSNSTPQGVQVKKLTMNGPFLSVEGFAVDFASVAHLAINLGGSNLLADAMVDSARRDEKDPRQIVFNVTATINPAARPGAGGAVVARPRILDFYADWCGPCKEMKPVIAEAMVKYGDRVEFLAINVDDPASRPFVDKYSVKALPTLVFIDAKGAVVEQIVGYNGPEPIMTALDKVSTIAASGTAK